MTMQRKSPRSHVHLRPNPVDLRDPSNLLFVADGQRAPLLQTLYTESLVNRRDVDAIDRLLDAHRMAYGEPEQVAYAQQRDGLHDRPVPLVSSDGCVGDAGLQHYLEEHRAWNPVTQRERTLSSQTLGMSA
ncbi:hypothetical protein [Stenotrophomonas acidaminiphila]|uniref:hypothetical protein n=1 Tax=Stenotrophomonas acidaminiphila TaxID=128780 RepID=UPI0020C62517|nr:hypothetical protein [Stenotrophomonas acidaminiphila]